MASLSVPRASSAPDAESTTEAPAVPQPTTPVPKGNHLSLPASPAAAALDDDFDKPVERVPTERQVAQQSEWSGTPGCRIRGPLWKKYRWPRPNVLYEFFLFDDPKNNLHMLSYASKLPSDEWNVHNRIPFDKLDRVEDLPDDPDNHKYHFRVVYRTTRTSRTASFPMPLWNSSSAGADNVKILEVYAKTRQEKDRWLKHFSEFVRENTERSELKARLQEREEERKKEKEQERRLHKERERREKSRNDAIKAAKKANPLAKPTPRAKPTHTRRDTAAITIQKLVRGHVTRRRLPTVIELKIAEAKSRETPENSKSVSATIVNPINNPDAVPRQSWSYSSRTSATSSRFGSVTELREVDEDEDDDDEEEEEEKTDTEPADKAGDSTGVAADQEDADADALDVEKGEVLLKYHTYGIPKARRVYIHKEKIWWADGDNPKGSLRLADIERVQMGKITKAFQRVYAMAVSADVCFSLVTEQRSLDLSCSSPERRQAWVDAIEKFVMRTRAATAGSIGHGVPPSLGKPKSTSM